jgi:hypothetical protein
MKNYQIKNLHNKSQGEKDIYGGVNYDIKFNTKRAYATSRPNKT